VIVDVLEGVLREVTPRALATFSSFPALAVLLWRLRE